jgi:hypothetical protein
VTETSAGFSVTTGSDGRGDHPALRGLEADAEPYPIPFVVWGGSEKLFDPDLVTHDLSLLVVTIKVFTLNGSKVGAAGIFAPGIGYSRVEGGFTPIFIKKSPLE